LTVSGKIDAIGAAVGAAEKISLVDKVAAKCGVIDIDPRTDVGGPK